MGVRGVHRLPIRLGALVVKVGTVAPGLPRSVEIRVIILDAPGSVQLFHIHRFDTRDGLAIDDLQLGQEVPTPEVLLGNRHGARHLWNQPIAAPRQNDGWKRSASRHLEKEKLIVPMIFDRRLLTHTIAVGLKLDAGWGKGCLRVFRDGNGIAKNAKVVFLQLLRIQVDKVKEMGPRRVIEPRQTRPFVVVRANVGALEIEEKLADAVGARADDGLFDIGRNIFCFKLFEVQVGSENEDAVSDALCMLVGANIVFKGPRFEVEGEKRFVMSVLDNKFDCWGVHCGIQSTFVVVDLDFTKSLVILE